MDSASTSKRRSCCDYISSMPDSILHHILSLLDTHEAVRMCTLSKRWADLWTYLPDLTFDLRSFKSSCLPVLKEGLQSYVFDMNEGKRKADRFVHFVSTVLLRRQPCNIHSFRLDCDSVTLSRQDHFKAWIVYAVQHNVRVLHVEALSSHSFPSCIWACSSLENLYLNPFCCDLYRLTDVNLPNLRELHLNEAFLDNCFSKLLFCGCPFLEKVCFEDCDFVDCDVSSNSLKHLRIVVDGDRGSYYDTGFRHNMKISAPNLTSFSFDGEPVFMQQTIFESTSSLIHVDFRYYCGFEEGYFESFAAVTSIENLVLRGHYCDVFLEGLLPKLTVFDNLTNLTIGGLCLSCHFNVLARFLEHLPNLKKLVLHHDGWNCEMDMHDVPTNSSTHLLPIKCKSLSEIEVKYFINDSSVKQFLGALVDGTMELPNIKMVLSLRPVRMPQQIKI
ncbi:hypothetical protein LUZ63_016614 [Rhynchospora breviuscula]|uniref:F-box domain-containing protein n=1 Tax=Rhynchospora breviuscula TaxID=2022672 RepID=A0A9P9ZA74_9POAL|nr:hypothetical protein LUZ63_016614 [Rhynchospora breviuscula]